MPAVQLARLKEQITQLAWHFTRPQEFQKSLHALLDSYADRTYRPGQAVKPHPLLPSYHVAPLILAQLKQELGKLCQAHPAASLALVEILWVDPYLEPRLLAAALLGQTPLSPPEPVLARLLAWSQADVDGVVLEALLDDGSLKLRREQPDRWLRLIEEWLSSTGMDMKIIGIKALLPLIQDRQFENLPRVFRLLTPMFGLAGNDLQAELLRDLEGLARRSPSETVYFLRQMLTMNSSPTTVRMVRRCLPALSEEGQASVRKALTQRDSRTNPNY